MNQKNGLHVALGIIGLAALMTYVLACQPSWSPDGSKVLFPYYHPENKEWGVALYNRTTGTVKSIFVEAVPDGANDDDFMKSVQWTHDGKQAIVSGLEDDLSLLLLPVGSQKPARRIVVPGTKEYPGLPFVEAAGNLYVGGKSLARISLATGEAAVQKLEDGSAVLADWDGTLLYIMNVGSGEDTRFEFGELDSDSLVLKPFFDLKKADLAAKNVEDVFGFLTPEPRGSRFITTGRAQNKEVILVFTKTNLERVLAPQIPVEKYWLGGAQWAPGGKTIYAAVLTPTTEKDIVQFSVGEIPLAAGPVRLTPIARIGGEPPPSQDRIFFQIALSPDGTTIAATTAHLEKVEAKDRALYLVNLRDPKRRVTKVPIPRPVKPAAIPKEQPGKEKMAPSKVPAAKKE